MKIRHFLDRIEHDHIQTAIQAAEAHTKGRIVVYIGHRHLGDAVAEAHRLFRKLRVESETGQAGLLLLVAPKDRKFAIVGGATLHAKLGQDGWDCLAEKITKEFRQENYTAGILAVIEEAGQTFRAHFRGQPLPASGPDLIEE